MQSLTRPREHAAANRPTGRGAASSPGRPMATRPPRWPPPESSPADRPAVRSLMVRLDDESKESLSQAARLRGISLSDYVRAVTVPQARREVLAAHPGALPPELTRNAPALTADSKPQVLYVGAEYCPFCAAERWALIAALSRFGAFSNLHTTTSSSEDVYPNTPSFTFHGATYTSQYISLSAVEQFTNQRSGNGYAPLQALSTEQKAIVDQYDRPPYVSAAGGIPFIDFGGEAIQLLATALGRLLLDVDESNPQTRCPGILDLPPVPLSPAWSW